MLHDHVLCQPQLLLYQQAGCMAADAKELDHSIFSPMDLSSVERRGSQHSAPCRSGPSACWIRLTRPVVRYNDDVDEENVEGELFAKLDAEAASMSQAKNVEREMLDRLKREMTESMDMGAFDDAARERYLLDVANEMDMGELDTRAREQYEKGETAV